MSTLNDAITKLKIAGFATPPDIGTIQQLTGLGPDEKMALLQAARSGNLPAVWGPVGNQQNAGQMLAAAAPSTGLGIPDNSTARSQIPAAALQQRDTQVNVPGGGPDRAADDFGTGQRSTVPGVTGTAGHYSIPGDKGTYNQVPQWYIDAVNNKQVDAQGVPLNQGQFGPASNPQNAGLYPPTPQVPASSFPDPGNLPGGSIYDSQVPKAPTGPLPDWRVKGYDPRAQKAGGVPGSTGGDPEGGAGEGDIPVPTMPDYPDPTPLALPDYSNLVMPGPIDFKFVNRDFTKQGQKLAEDAWAPQYEALKGIRQDTTDRYNTSALATKVMYDRLAEELTQDQAADDARYAGKVTDLQKELPKAKSRTAANYDDSARIMAQVLGNVGDSSTNNNPEAQKVAADMAAQRAMALGNTEGSNQARIESTQDSGDTLHKYEGSMITANREQGAASKEALLRQLHQSLSGYDQQELGYQSEQRQAALQLADQLFGRDQDFQQREYGQLQDANQNAWNQYNAGVNQINGVNQVTNQNIGQENSAAQGKYGADIDNYWKQVQLDYQRTQDEINTQIEIAKTNAAATGAAGSIDNLGPMGVIKQQIINDTPGAQASQQEAAFQQAISLYGDIKNGSYKDLNEFVYNVITKNPGIPQEVARAAAMAVWAGMLKINEPPKPNVPGINTGG